MGRHARVSPSASKRWLNCPPSVVLCESVPEEPSVYAEEGQLAHQIGELKLQKLFQALARSTFSGRMNKLKAHELYQPEMQEHADTYVEVVRSKMCEDCADISIEVEIDLSEYIPEGFGTCDCLIAGKTKLTVIDFKYGAGVPVSAYENEQMMIYALGAYRKFEWLYPIREVEMIIVQPRLDSITDYTMGIKDLLEWGESIKPIAKMAFDGLGELKAGDHCRFCNVKSTCRARADQYKELTAFNNALPPLLSNEQIGDVLAVAEGLAAWVKDLQEYALAALLKGEDIRGWKVVAGRSNRKFADVEKAFRVLVASGIEEAMLYTREPIAMGATEKLVGKKVFKELLEDAGLVIKPEGKPTLAKSSDARGEFGNAASDFEGLGVEV